MMEESKKSTLIPCVSRIIRSELILHPRSTIFPDLEALMVTPLGADELKRELVTVMLLPSSEARAAPP
jgi:hypothetical protein